MNVIAMVLARTAALCCDPVYSIGDLTSPIQYVDKQAGYFIGIEKTQFTMGFALNNKDPANDVPQFSGQVQNCSSKTFKCKSIADLVFVIPRSTGEYIEYSKGPRISINRLEDGGWRGSATCSTMTKTGCSPQVDANKLVIAYQYDVDPRGTLTSIRIQDWNTSGKLVSSQNLILVSKTGLKLDRPKAT